MISWELTDDEIRQIRSVFEHEYARRGDILRTSKNLTPSARESHHGLQRNIHHLLKSLNQAEERANEKHVDVLCYCDTNYDHPSRSLTTHYRIGDEEPVHTIKNYEVEPPPDEYLGIIGLLQEIRRRELKGSVLVITDAARCAIALQMGLRYRVPKHSENQAPRSVNFGFSYDSAMAIIKELLTQGCKVEFEFKHRGFINEALNIAA